MNRLASSISCIILAGGEGKRAGGSDKGLHPYKNTSGKNRPLIEHVIDAVKDQVDDIVISANRNSARYKRYSATVVADSGDGYQGPLAGITACMKHCRHEQILVVACDMPKLPGDLVTRLLSAMHNKAISIATVDGRHQLALIINNNLATSLQRCLNNNQLKLIRWVESISHSTVSFDDKAEAFANLNHLTVMN